LDAVYPIVYLNCIVVKIRQDKRVLNKAVYLALGVKMEGHKELLGLWLSENDGAKLWLNVLTELRNRGVKDILIACVDGLKGFPDAIKKRKLFPTDDSAKKVIYLAVQAAAKKWTMPIRNWKLALNRFMIEFEDRLAEYI
jgi:transposase-like protein